MLVSIHSPINIHSMTIDSLTLHHQFVELGRQRNRLTYQLLELLPEIFERKIYKKYGCVTIEEYSGKFAGLPKSVVQKRLRLEKHLVDKPALKALVGSQGVHKVALVANFATVSTDKLWADKVQNMSKAGLESLAKEMRGHLAQQQKLSSFPCSAASERITLELTGELLFLFLKMKKRFGGNLSHSEALKKMLEKLQGVSESKNVKIRPLNYTQPSEVENKQQSESRYIPVPLRTMALASTSGKCSYPNCQHPYELFHHRERFANHKSHDSIVPLCKNHHEFMHNGLIIDEKNAPENWKIEIADIQPLSFIDERYREMKMLRGP